GADDGRARRHYVDYLRARDGVRHHRGADESPSDARRVRHRRGTKAMSLLRNHIVLMSIYAVATGLYFALLWKKERRAQVIFFGNVFVGLFLGGIALAWLMYFAPYK